MPNILVYDTSCSTRGAGGGGVRVTLEIVAFLAHSHPTISHRESLFKLVLGHKIFTWHRHVLLHSKLNNKLLKC